MKTFLEIDKMATMCNHIYRKLMWYFIGFAKLFFGDKVTLQFLASLFRAYNVFKN